MHVSEKICTCSSFLICTTNMHTILNTLQNGKLTMVLQNRYGYYHTIRLVLGLVLMCKGLLDQMISDKCNCQNVLKPLISKACTPSEAKALEPATIHLPLG